MAEIMKLTDQLGISIPKGGDYVIKNSYNVFG